MNKLSAKSIQTFVAGALAYMGFHALVWFPYYLIFSKNFILVGDSIFAGLALLIGLAMFIGSTHSIRWAYIYLWFSIASALGMICISAFQLLGSGGERLHWGDVSSLLAPAVLLLLLVWSHSKRFRDEPDA
jgi:hypothetical protein